MAKTLLLADDSVTIQKVVGISFANEDVRLLTVDNGDDALLRAREARPDLILADVVMPGKNGYEVCEAVKSDPALAGIPVLLLSGTFEAFDENRAASVRADGHITKPFEAQALVDKVNGLLARAAAAPPPPPAPAERPAAPAPQAASAPPMAPPPQAAADGGTDDDGFDFFDDDLDGDAGPPSDATTAFELDAGESAFDFAPAAEPADAPKAPPSERATEITPPPSGQQPTHSVADATVALGVKTSSGDVAWNDDDLDAAFGDSGVAAESDQTDPHSRTTVFEMDASSPLAPPAGPREEPDEVFSFAEADGDEDFFGDFGAPDAPREAVSNPELGRDFAVSSSDLGEPLGAEASFEEGDSDAAFSAAEPLPSAPASPEPEFAVTPEPSFDEADFGADVPTVSPDETAFAQGAGPVLEARPEPEEPPFHSAFSGTEVPVEGPEEPSFDALESPDEAFTPLAEAAAADFAPPPPQRSQPGAGGSGAAGPDISPLMRERIHEAMEKIAWEAFADLPDQIVRQALTRIEAIAWEVIPQMAEAMIREEIRRMKGEPE